MKKFILSIFILLSIIGCNNNVQVDENIIKVGMEVGYAPFNWYQKNSSNDAVKIPSGYAGGYDVQIAKIIAEKLGKKLVIVPSDWDSLLGPAVNSDKVDLVIAGMSPTTQRKKSLDFTDSYYSANIVLVVRKDNKYANGKTLKDFNGAKVTGQLNTLHYDLIDQLEGANKLVAMENFPAMLVALNSGIIDCYVAEKPTALAASSSDSNITYIEFSDGGFKYDKSEVDVAIGIKKGRDDLRLAVNEALSTISMETREKLMSDAINNQPLNEEAGFEDLNFFGWIKYILSNYGMQFIKGTMITIYLAVVGTFVGFLIGIVVAIVNTSKSASLGILRYINKLYILVVRGTPMIVQSMIFYYGLAQVFNINMSPILAASIIISVNTGAYISEIIRGGIISIDKGQYEAGIALGFNHRQTLQYIVLPQAIRNVIPSIGNEFIVNVKDSSVLFAIGVTELYTISKQIAGTNFKYYEVFIITCFIYFILTTVFTYLLKLLEKKLDGNENYEMVV